MTLSDGDLVTTWRAVSDPPVSGAWSSHGLSERRAEGEAALAQLVGDTAEFFAERWERSPHHFAGDRASLTGLFRLTDLDAILTGSKLQASDLRLVREGKPIDEIVRPANPGAGPTAPDDVVDPARVIEAIGTGATLALYDLEVRWPRLRELCDVLSIRLSHPVEALAFLTPAGSPGFARHFDAYDVLVIQMHGSKDWVVESPKIDLPIWSQRRANALLDDPIEGDVVLETTLTPGQCLYIPRGFIHTATPRSTTSVHVSLAIKSVTVEWALRQQVQQAATQVQVLRTTHPPAFAATAGTQTGVDVNIDDVGTDDPFGRTIRGIRFDPVSVLRVSREQYWNSHRSPTAGRLAQILELDGVVSDTPIRRTPRTVVRTQTGDERVYLRIDDRELSIPVSLGAWVTQLLDGRATTVDRLCGPAEHPDALVLVRRLIREGVLTRAS